VYPAGCITLRTCPACIMYGVRCTVGFSLWREPLGTDSTTRDWSRPQIPGSSARLPPHTDTSCVASKTSEKERAENRLIDSLSSCPCGHQAVAVVSRGPLGSHSTTCQSSHSPSRPRRKEYSGTSSHVVAHDAIEPGTCPPADSTMSTPTCMVYKRLCNVRRLPHATLVAMARGARQ
jgi:hypothetical protein